MTAPAAEGSPDREFVRVCSVTDLPDATPLAVQVGTVELCLVKTEEQIFAIDDECSHAAIALSEGDVEGCTIECWLHGSRFDLRTGEPTGPPATQPVPTYPVRIDGDDVLVAVG